MPGAIEQGMTTWATMTNLRTFALAAAAIAHDGELLGVVKEGVLTHYRSDCTIDGTYTTGQSIAEKGGPGYVHIGRNLGPEPLVLQVLYIDPAGAPLSDDQPDPGCGFA
jgi:hypothetical protein